MLAEVAVEGLLEPADLGAHPEARQLRERLGVASPAINAAIIARPETPKMSEATTESLMQASSRAHQLP